MSPFTSSLGSALAAAFTVADVLRADIVDVACELAEECARFRADPHSDSAAHIANRLDELERAAKHAAAAQRNLVSAMRAHLRAHGRRHNEEK
jgi:hypothetical protein